MRFHMNALRQHVGTTDFFSQAWLWTQCCDPQYDPGGPAPQIQTTMVVALPLSEARRFGASGCAIPRLKPRLCLPRQKNSVIVAVTHATDKHQTMDIK